MAAFEYRQAQEIRDALQRHGVRYLFIGKSGAILLGFPDTTQDADLFVDKSPTNGRALVTALRDLGFAITTEQAGDIERGRDVVFTAALDGVRGIYRKPANGSGKEELLLPSPTNPQIPGDVSATGTLVFTEIDPKTRGDIWYVSTTGEGARTPEKFLATAAMESQPQLSRDGRWLAYVSDESGQFEVYVRQFPSGPGFAKASSNGGREPRWKHDGSELYFREETGVTNSTLLAVPMHADSRGGLSAGVPVALFRFTAVGVVPQYNAWQYAPSPDGQRFLVAVNAETAAPAIHVITNWLKATQDAGKE